MSSVSFTGSSAGLLPVQKDLIAETVAAIKGQPSAFFSGAARGVDIWAAACAIKTFPESKHVVIVPHYQKKQGATIRHLASVKMFQGSPVKTYPCKHDEHGVERLVATAEKYGADLAVYGPEFAGYPDEYTGLMVRNDVLALNGSHMMAFPNTGKEIQRSGTWATVRRAHKRRRPILVTPLNGDNPYVYGT